jgi:hypothetical protein
MALPESIGMKNLLPIFVSLSLVWSLAAEGAELKKLEDINTAALTSETQKISTVDGVHLAWWIPPEFWEASLVKRSEIPAAGRESFMKALRGYSMMAITQGEVRPMGNIEFYEREAIIKGAKIELFDGKNWSRIEPVEKIPDDLEQLIKLLGPTLEAALGKLGQNLQIFVFDDEVAGKRLISPFGNSTMRVSLTNKNGNAVPPLVFEMPLDSLYVPRMCPNGKPAHISWVVCPWDGTKLPR